MMSPNDKHRELGALSRRDFVRTAALGAAGLGAFGFTGCAPDAPGSNPDDSDGAGAGAGGGAPVSDLANSYANTRFAFRSDWLGEAPSVADDNITEILESDIVVVGAGHAGSAVTRKASELGARVIAVEAQPEESYAAFGSDIGHLNSTWQAEQGIPVVDTTDFMEVCQLLSANRIQPDLLRKYATRSGEMFDWLREVMSDEQQSALQTCDWPVDPGYQYVKGAMRAYPGTAKMDMQNETINTTILLKAQHARATENGARILYAHKGEYLVTTDSRVVGVVVSDADGAYKRIDASKAVVLAAGDYAGNAEMFTALIQEAAELNPGVALQGMGRDGSGTKMGLWAGGKMEPGTRAAMGANVFSPASPISAASLWLNAKGARFCNEGYGHPFIAGLQGARQPFGALYAVWDSNWRTMLKNQLTGHGDPMFWNDAFMDSIEPTLAEALNTGAKGFEAGTLMASYKLYAAQSLDELAGYLGVDAGAFKASVERYNQMCANGKDSDYAKTPSLLFPVDTPPFYASVGDHQPGGRILVTLGGLFVDGNQNVIGDDFNSIPGLYATGNNSGGRFPLQYFAPIHGMSLGMANTLGYVLGEELATG
jgi:succinate dehydrogenase/fumarate reductase flavoprotein subunit